MTTILVPLARSARVRRAGFLTIGIAAGLLLLSAGSISSQAAGSGQAAASPSPSATGLPLIETEIVTINDHSAWPSIITRPQGPFFLMIRNRTRTLTGLSLTSANAPSGVAAITQGLNLSNVLSQRRSSGYLN